nr:MAG TPA: hypothetical protein [Caudoviricetes sp.]
MRPPPPFGVLPLSGGRAEDSLDCGLPKYLKLLRLKGEVARSDGGVSRAARSLVPQGYLTNGELLLPCVRPPPPFGVLPLTCRKVSCAAGVSHKRRVTLALCETPSPLRGTPPRI